MDLVGEFWFLNFRNLKDYQFQTRFFVAKMHVTHILIPYHARLEGHKVTGQDRGGGLAEAEMS